MMNKEQIVEIVKLELGCCLNETYVDQYYEHYRQWRKNQFYDELRAQDFKCGILVPRTYGIEGKGNFTLSEIVKMHNVWIVGPICLQVEQMINIARIADEGVDSEDDVDSGEDNETKEAQEMFKELVGKEKTQQFAGGARMLQMTCTDGIGFIDCLEYHYLNMIHQNMPNQFKIIIQKALVRRGTLMLTPNGFSVL